MLIAQLSDTHILTEASDHPAAELRAGCLRRAVAAINKQRPDAVIFTGDTVQHGDPEEYARLIALLDPLEAPLYVVPGNRDDKQALRAAFAGGGIATADGTFLQYAVDDHELRLVAIDTTLAGERKGRFCEERQAWLEEILRERPDRPTVLFLHHPPFDVGHHYVGGYRLPGEATALEDIVNRHAQVVAVICGHVHWPVERKWAGTEARIMPSIAVDVRKGVDEDAVRGRPVYMLHRFAGGKLETSCLMAA